MALMSGLLGNATEVDSEEIKDEMELLLIDGEKVDKAYKLVRDLFIFTNKRFLMIDRQGITGRKTDYHSIPYKSITHFKVETAGHFDLDAELKIWISGESMPIQKKFNKKLSIYDVQKVLSKHIFNSK